MTQTRIRDALMTGAIDIVEATSFPSFYHLDLALLRALEIDNPQNLSKGWADQVLLWKRLLANWLLDNVREQAVKITGPLLRYVPLGGESGTGLDSVAWILDKTRGTQVLGVRSPILIVRPLEAGEPVTPVGRGEPWLDMRLPHLVERLLSVLDASFLRCSQDDGRQSLARQIDRLRTVLRRHFPEAARSIIGGIRYLPTSVVLVGLDPNPDKSSWELIEIVRLGGIRNPPADVRFPECAVCRKAALPLAVDLADGVGTYQIGCPHCEHPVNIDLEDYGIGWSCGTGRPEFILWIERNFIWAGRQPLLPPVPAVSDHQIEFRYDPSHQQIAAIPVADRRLRFKVGASAARIQCIRLRDIVHKRLLWPMADELSNGGEPWCCISPLLTQHQKLLRNRDTRPTFASVDDPESGNVSFVLELVGIPGAVLYQATGVKRVQSPGLAVFPDPAIVPPNWVWFRFAVSSEVEIRLPQKLRVSRQLPSVCTVEDGLPEVVELVDGGNPQTGCTISLSILMPDCGGRLDARFGVDFGSSASVVFAKGDRGPAAVEGPFLPEALRDGAVRWLVEPSAESREVVLGSILGKVPARTTASDRALVSSELCGHDFVNWGDMPCCSKDKIRRIQRGDAPDFRMFHTYLEELLLHSLAYLFRQLSVRPSSFLVRPYLAVPLGLERGARDKFCWYAERAWERVISLSGGERTSPTFVPASEAAMLASAPQNAGETLLSADLGGGSLNLALWRCGEDCEYFGSLAVGGRGFLDRVGSEIGCRPDQLVEHVGPGTQLQEWMTPPVRDALKKYFAILFTFIETTLLGYLERRDQEALPCTIAIYLFGNGWRLAEPSAVGVEFSTRTLERTLCGFWITKLQTALSKAGHAGARIELRLPAEPSGLRLAVARGALEANEPREWRGARLPAGISFSAGATAGLRVAWSDPFGSGVDPDSVVVPELDKELRFDFEELKVRLSRSSIFAETGLTADCASNEGEIRREFAGQENRVPGIVGPSIVRGPLQVLLERIWLRSP